MLCSSLRTAIFDLGGVCFTNGTTLAVQRLAQKFGLPSRHVAAVLCGPLGTEYREGRIGAAEFWAAALERWGIRASPDRLNRIWLSSYRKIPGTFALLRRLGEVGHELLYLSDNVPERVEYLESRHPFLQCFKGGLFSYQAGMRKPDPRFYQRILGEASHPASRCLYIDDMAEYLEPARRLGMTVVHFRGARHLERELHRLGLL